MAYDYQTVATQHESPPQPSQLAQIENELDSLVNRLAQSTGELGSIADRVFGTQPQAVAQSLNGHPIGSGIVSAIGVRLSALTAEIEAIEERTKRLSAL